MLDIHTDTLNDVVVVECNGRIVQSDSAFALRDAVMLQEGANVILLDLSRVSAIEGGGLGMLMFLQRWAYDRDIRFKVFNPTKAVCDRLRMTNCFPEFEIITLDEMQALLGGVHMRFAA